MKNYLLILVFASIPLESISQSGTSYDCWNFNECDYFFYEPPDSTNAWAVGSTTSKDGFSHLFYREHCLMTDTAYGYPKSNKSSIVFKFMVGDLDWLTDLGFEHYIDSDTLRDGGYIEVSYDTGKTWTNILFDTIFYHNNPYNLYTATDSLIDGNTGFSGKFDNSVFQHYWRPVSYNWTWPNPGSSPPVDSLFLRFTFISDSIDTGKPGWIIRGISLFGIWEGINNSNSNSLFYVYPNPVSDYLTVNFRYLVNNEFNVMIFNMTGSLVENHTYQPSEKLTIPVNQLREGMYILQINQDQRYYYSPFVKN